MNNQETTAAPKLVTIGSLNMDLVLQVDRLPQPGETIRAHELTTIPGGKGANQAVGVARLGGSSLMIGRVGEDAFGHQLLNNLQSFQVNTQNVLATKNCSSGVALINVEAGGQNSITIVSGANGRMTPQDLIPLESVIGQADAVILQLEIPMETVAAALKMARQHKVTTILDPAPAPLNGLPEEVYNVDILTPNQTEAELLTGRKINDKESAECVVQDLLKRGAKNVVLKMGAAGALIATDLNSMVEIDAFDVAVVDTTAAGDAFTAGLALQLAKGSTLQQATQFACAAGSLATTKFGAQPSMPSLAEVQSMINHSINRL